MELLDFTYWNKLNEETSRISKILRIPNRNIQPELEKEYFQTLNKILEETAGDAEYEITVDNKNSWPIYTIHFKKEEDEIFSSVFGSPELFTIDIIPTFPQYTSYGVGVLSLNNLILKTMKYFYTSVREIEDGDNVIRITTTPELFEKGLVNIASSFIGWSREIPEKPLPQDYDDAYLKASDDPTYITKLKDKIFNATVYDTILNYLKSNIEDYIINQDELSASISSELNKIKQLDFTKDNESSLKEALTFQKKLLKMAHPNKEESALVTDALVDVFRLLLDQYGDIKSLNTALSKV